MSSIFFMAVQCCECSTMQVKQRKTNTKTNKWTCVVCNQKQSIGKMFAQGPMAKDLRFFVQSFNLSRQSASDFPPSEEQVFEDEDQTLISSDAQNKRPRTDWSQFLDPEEECRIEMKPDELQGRGDFEPEIVTELPMELFKKPKLNKYACSGSDSGEGGDKLYKPVFSKRTANKQASFQETKQKNDDPKIAKDASSSKWSQYEQKLSKPEDKWSRYITEDDDDDDLTFRTGTKFADHENHCSNNNIFQTITSDECIEEDIHPDFI